MMQIFSSKMLTAFFCSVLFLYNNCDAANWRYKREITVENKGSGIPNATVLVELTNSNFDYTRAKKDGADIRFALGKNLKSSGLSYWIEEWNNNGLSRIWVQIPNLKAGKSIEVSLFYGNPAAEAVSDGDHTFLFFDDFESGDFTKKWTNTSIGQVEEKDGLLKLKETDGEDGIITADFNVTGKMIIRSLYQRGGADQHWVRAGVGGWNNWLCFGDYTDFAGIGTNYVMLFDSSSISNLKTSPRIKAANKVISDKWRPVAYWYNGNSLMGMQDDVTVAWPMANASSKLTLRTLDNDEWDNFAFITVSPYTDAVPTVAVGQEETVK